MNVNGHNNNNNNVKNLVPSVSSIGRTELTIFERQKFEVEHINAKDVIAFCLYLINKCGEISLLAENNANEVIGFCLHLFNNVRWKLS